MRQTPAANNAVRVYAVRRTRSELLAVGRARCQSWQSLNNCTLPHGPPGAASMKFALQALLACSRTVYLPICSRVALAACMVQLDTPNTPRSGRSPQQHLPNNHNLCVNKLPSQCMLQLTPPHPPNPHPCCQQGASPAGRALLVSVAGTTSAGRLRYSRRYSMPLSVRNLHAA